jgi:two-component system C4-dicarboxylate transport sensor histidine kinase DctB
LTARARSEAPTAPPLSPALLADHARLSGVVDELRRSVELRIIRDIRFDVDRGALSFVEDTAQSAENHEIFIHAADQPFFLLARKGDAKTVEYRIAGAEVLECFLLTIEQNTGGYTWERGTIIKLRQPQRLRELFVRQARLVDLGSMISAISHEIKQPLFTIAMAAESIGIILRKQPGSTQAQHVERCAARITTQVARARQIMRRILQHGRPVSATPDRSDPATALEMCCAFMLPLLKERDIQVVMNVDKCLPEVSIAQISLEQVLVNAIQNAADSILSARALGRAAGTLELYAHAENGGVRCGVRDDGIGVEKNMEVLAFDAFFTTKSVNDGSGMGLFISRQIINESAGTIGLQANAETGATLEVWLPLFTEDLAIYDHGADQKTSAETD